MGEVKYSINGKYFKDRKVYVSDSEGLFDALKRKKINTYDWAEYHGQSVDLSNPKYEAREITLKCFVVGDNWVDMKENHDAIVSEFQKSGTQRLLIEPFGMKPLTYEVYMEDSSPLEKTFKEGQMVGVFTLKLIEPNPIKKVLYTTLDTLNLSYNSSKETEIFFVNGEKTTARGNVSLSGKTLANRVVSGYNFSGRNLIIKSRIDTLIYDNEAKFIFWSAFSEPLKVGSTYVFRGFNKTKDFAELFLSDGVNDYNNGQNIFEGVPFVAQFPSKSIRSYHRAGDGDYYVEYIKLEKGNKSTDWTPAPEDERYIIIAGNVDEITGLTTNATVLWEKL